MSQTDNCSLTCARHAREDPALAKLDRAARFVELLQNGLTAVPRGGLGPAAKVLAPVAHHDSLVVLAVDDGRNVARHFDWIAPGQPHKELIIKSN